MNKPYAVTKVGSDKVLFEDSDLGKCKKFIVGIAKPGEKFQVAKVACVMGVEQVTKTKMVEL